MPNSLVPQRIVCAANRHIFSHFIVLGIRHFDDHMIQQIDLKRECNPNEGGDQDWRWEQGFVDQHGKFLDRNQAWQIAQAAGQIIRSVGGDTANGGTLYSENLY